MRGLESGIMRLTREIRFSLGGGLDTPVTNSWAGWPGAAGLQPYLRLQAVVEGAPNPVTGYLCNIRLIDDVLRNRAIGRIQRLVMDTVPTGEQVIHAVAAELAQNAPTALCWVSFTLYVTPYLQYSIDAGAMNMVRVTQSFEFAAAHRLHCPELSDEENRETFGKCNNPNGHGHNYQLEVTIQGTPDVESGVVLPIARFESIVRRRVIDLLDHKHLNEDCPEFAGLNPSVENIAQVIWTKLEAHFAPAKLQQVRLYETPKTWADVAVPA